MDTKTDTGLVHREITLGEPLGYMSSAFDLYLEGPLLARGALRRARHFTDTAARARRLCGEVERELERHAVGPRHPLHRRVATSAPRTAVKKSRIVKVRFGTARPKTMDESETPPTHLGSCRYLTLNRGVLDCP
jgi:hypothetical protein